ncbi:MAG: DUF3303 domain-containing protein [Mycobacterium sp.]|nr:DUF3303 domain-containing protein [Mycobacterium sp.]
MKYLLSYTTRLNGSGAENEQTIKRALEVFSKWTPPQGATFHQWVSRVDGNGGCAVIETDNVADLLDGVAKFAFINQFEVHPVIGIDEAMQALQKGVDFRESIPH